MTFIQGVHESPQTPLTLPLQFLLPLPPDIPLLTGFLKRRPLIPLSHFGLACRIRCLSIRIAPAPRRLIRNPHTRDGDLAIRLALPMAAAATRIFPRYYTAIVIVIHNGNGVTLRRIVVIRGIGLIRRMVSVRHCVTNLGTPSLIMSENNCCGWC